MLIGADRTKVPSSFLTQVESAASINVEAVIKAAFLRLRVWNNVAAAAVAAAVAAAAARARSSSRVSR